MKLKIRYEQDGEDRRSLEVHLEGGDLHIEGRDSGPGTAPVSSDGEYEWWKTIAAKDIPRLVELLGGKPGDQIMTLLERDYMGRKSYDFEQIVRDSGIETHTRTWNG